MNLIFIKVKSVTNQIIFILILIANVATKGTYKVHSHSKSFCDYEKGLGKVNIQVIQEGLTNDKVSFNMNLVDNEENKYAAQCTIGEEKGIPEPEVGDGENESEKSDIKVDDDIKEYEKENSEKESIDVYIDVKVHVDTEMEEEKESIDIDVYTEKQEREKEFLNEDIDVVIDESSEEKLDDLDYLEVKDEKENESDRRRRLLKKKNSKEKLKKRKLEERYLSGICYFDPPKESYNLYYEKDSLALAPRVEDEVVIEDDFFVITQKCLSAEQAEKQLDIHISFRQLNKFEQKNDIITFYFFGLTNEKYEIGFTIEFYIYLILANGEKEKEERKVACSLEEPTVPNQHFPVQADFKCRIKGLKEQYSSLVFHHSDFISGVPKEEIYLNPYLTYLGILKEIILEHLSIMRQFHSDRYVHANFKKHIACYYKGIRGNKEVKTKAFESKSLDEMIKIIEDSNI